MIKENLWKEQLAEENLQESNINYISVSFWGEIIRQKQILGLKEAY